MRPFPNADQIAVAVVEACKLTNENPVDVVKGMRGPHARARHIAFAALIEAFPESSKRGLARCVGYSTPEAAGSNLKHITRRLKWWNEDWIEEVLGVLVADQYGEQAA